MMRRRQLFELLKVKKDIKFQSQKYQNHEFQAMQLFKILKVNSSDFQYFKKLHGLNFKILTLSILKSIAYIHFQQFK